jgi:hypothetical protein
MRIRRLLLIQLLFLLVRVLNGSDLKVNKDIMDLEFLLVLYVMVSFLRDRMLQL